MVTMFGEADGYLELRKRLKEKHRANLRKESSGDINQPHQISKNNHNEKDNYGSFFGPSVTLFSPRVIEQAKAVLNTTSNISSANSEPTGQGGPKKKTEKIKESRDYSFLSSDDAQVPVSIKKEEVKSRTDNKTVVNINKRRVTSDVDSKKQVSQTLSTKKPGLAPTNGKKQIMKNKPSSAVAGGMKSSGTKLQSVKREQFEKKQGMSGGEGKYRKVPISKEQLMKQKKELKRKPLLEDEEEDWRLELRKTTRYDPRKYIGMRDDDRNMEASYSEIQKEERRSAKFAKKEDAEELMKIEKEEREEKLRRAKKRKLQAKEKQDLSEEK